MDLWLRLTSRIFLVKLLLLLSSGCTNQSPSSAQEEGKDTSRTMRGQVLSIVRCGFYKSNLNPAFIDSLIQNVDRNQSVKYADIEESPEGFNFNEFKPTNHSSYYKMIEVRRLVSGRLAQIVFETKHLDSFRCNLELVHQGDQFSLFSAEIKVNDRNPAGKEFSRGMINDFGWFLFDHQAEESYFIGMRSHPQHRSGLISIVMQLDENLIPCKSFRFVAGRVVYLTLAEYGVENDLKFEHVWILPELGLDDCAAIEYQELASFSELDILDKVECKLYLGKMVPVVPEINFPSWILCGNHIQQWQEFIR
jgi:hypothetical protein